MANILMIEPNYKCKYPPLGLMKISYYHKEILGDTVWFCKGKLPEQISEEVIEQIKQSKYYKNKYGNSIDNHIKIINDIIENKKWDRVYVCTLFTFEYEETIKSIDYAKSLVGRENVYTGGIMATLMPDKLRKDTGVVVNTGQLTNSKLIGYNDGVNVDILTPDYSILDNTEYKYENQDAYYAYTTRGCGMNCGFCAVKTLEPVYNPFISIKDQINNVKELYGEKKDLLLMDNNVLKSYKLKEIVKEIVDLGFEKGAKYRNPKTGKTKQRFVDFNQGLDAFLMTEEKAKELGKIAIKPARIAFDHIEDAEVYERAIRRAAKNGINYLSNYLLYNADSFKGKGNQYKADSPEDLYNRLLLNVKLQEEFNENIEDKKEKVSIFSFPMRYIPLDNKQRGYIGEKWNKKYLRAIQSILIPTQGKGVSGKSFFEAAFGKNLEEFLKVILMPEEYIVSRGNPNMIKNIDSLELEKKLKTFNLYEEKRQEWFRLYDKLNTENKKNFEKVIGKNKFDYFSFKQLYDENGKKLFLHYLTNTGMINLLEKLYIENNEKDLNIIKVYIKKEFIYKYEELVSYMVKNNKFTTKLNIFKIIFGKKGYSDLLKEWILKKCETKEFIKYFSKVYNIEEEYLFIIRWALIIGVFNKNDISKVIEYLNKDSGKEKMIQFEKLLENIFSLIESNCEGKEEIVKDIKKEAVFQMKLLI